MVNDILMIGNVRLVVDYSLIDAQVGRYQTTGGPHRSAKQLSVQAKATMIASWGDIEQMVAVSDGTNGNTVATSSKMWAYNADISELFRPAITAMPNPAEHLDSTPSNGTYEEIMIEDAWSSFFKSVRADQVLLLLLTANCDLLPWLLTVFLMTN